MEHREHRYNTRSRGRCQPYAARGDGSPRRRHTLTDERRSLATPSSGSCLCTPTLFEKCVRITRIGIIVGLIVVFIWYSSDKTYNCLKRELDSLSGHISSMEDVLQKSSCKKCKIDKRLVEIADTLPQIKEMARTLREDVENCKTGRTKGNKCYDNVRSIVREELENYSADKTGRTDYALESSGGLILNTRNTKSFSAAGPTLSLFGIPICQSSNSPRALIQPGVMPGECWAFKGSCGSAVVKLVKAIYVTAVSVEHIPRSISPTGNTKTAPKEFSIWGLENPDELDGFFFGKFQYDVEGSSVQYFPVQHKSKYAFEIIEFKVHTNHGHPEYTCVYRLRVHGDLKYT